MSANQEALIDKQNDLHELINSAVEKLRSLGDGKITRAQIQTRMSILDANWKKFQEGHERLTNTRLTAAIKEAPYFANNLYSQCQETYADARSTMLTLLDQIIHSQPSAGIELADQSMNLGQSYVHHTRSLPKIQLPIFNGEYSRWRNFHDLFTSIIGSSSDLTTVEKFHYLKTSLKGEAAQLVANLAVSNENFARAWDILVARYENKRLLIDTQLDIIFKLQPIKRKSSGELKNLLAVFKESLGALNSLGAPTDHWDFIIVYMIVHRLDADSHEAWEIHRGATVTPASLTQLDTFLEGRIRALESVESRNPSSSACPLSSHNRKTSGAKVHVASVNTTLTPVQSSNRATFSNNCSMCNNSHYISTCPTYRSLDENQRKELLVEKRLCFNCLGPHRLATCRSTKRCQICGAQHHTSIHSTSSSSKQLTSSPSSGTASRPAPADSVEKPQFISNQAIPRPSVKVVRTLLATALVRLFSPQGKQLQVRALIDPGSQITIISEAATQNLYLKRQKASIPLYGVGAHSSSTTKGIVSFSLKPHFNSSLKWDVSAYILPKPTAEIPSLEFEHNDWPHLRGLTLADPYYLKTGQIDLIIGIDLYSDLIEPELVKGSSNSPFARRTALGWIISGPVSPLSEYRKMTQPIQSYQCSIDHDLHAALQRFWVQEEAQLSAQTILSKEEQECEDHFCNSHSRNSSGRYVVRLPFKKSPEAIGDSRPAASRMLSSMIRRFSCDHKLKCLYSDFLREYESLGHMARVPESIPEPQQYYYLPHHGVLKESSSSTKLRVVFNGSCRTSSGCSLNDLLHIGAKLQTDLSDVILWWRQFSYVFSADMEKMFRQILVHPDDQRFQRILWSPESFQKPLTYQLATVTYGLGPAPFLANRVIKQLTKDEGHRFPLATDVLLRGTYVDDCFGGADSPQDAKEVIQQLDNLCKSGGFNLLKWTANDSTILADLSITRHASSTSRFLDGSPLFRTLGIIWNPVSDAFVFLAINTENDTTPTKRKVLSRIAQLFDPLGWLAPITVRAKIFMQELWLTKLNWDDQLPESLSQRWNQFLNQLQDISHISIPRWIGTSANMLTLEIHGFSDASRDAMAAVVYLRVLNKTNDATISLITAKTKVAPIKKMTIPRLELCAATLLTKQVAHVAEVLNISQAPIHLWTDSSVTLAWIQAHPSRWKDYVRNRVVTIQETLPQATWHHISGKENPADCASRGVSLDQLEKDCLWWTGPKWLSQHPSLWPSCGYKREHDVDLEEKLQVIAVVSPQNPKIWNLVERYSNLTKLLRITALCQRAIKILQRKADIPKQSSLTPTELETARLYWVKLTQQAYFSKEILTLSQNRILSNTNPLNKLIPFIDASGMLRVGGRLGNSLLDPDTKHPVILPRESPLTTLIISNAHHKTLHGGTQVTLAYLRRSYWIIGGRSPVRSFILRCVRCARYRAVTAQQLMGQLPSTRITPARPFLNSGVDYAGPFTLKTSRARAAKTYKGYIVLFVCFATSAIHLEIATDYSSEGFLAAYKRFTGRRGICATLHSDCGTNLIGADAELRKLFSRASNELSNLASLLANDGTEWRFNPPAAPHFGGKWEAGVKSVKFHLKRIIGDTSLTYEEFSTLLAQIEAVLNSRPLCPLSDDPNDINALTPGHFLIGSALTTVPEPSLIDIAVSRLSRWQLLRQMLEHFWHRWSSEYIQRFYSISKWKQATDPIKKGALVLLVDERFPPAKWLLGRIIDTHPGNDGHIRVVTVRTKDSTLKRPVVKLCPLPVLATSSTLSTA